MLSTKDLVFKERPSIQRKTSKKFDKEIYGAI